MSQYLDSPRVKGRGQIVSPNGVWHSVYKGVNSLLVPNNPKVKVSSGIWQLRFAVEKKEGVRLKRIPAPKAAVLYKVRTGREDRQVDRSQRRITHRLKINAYATQGSNMGRSKLDFDRKIQKATSFYKSIGVKLSVESFKIIGNTFDTLSDSLRFPEKFQIMKELWSGQESVRDENGMRTIDVYFSKRNNFTNKGIATLAGASMSVFDPSAFNGVSIFVSPGRDPSMTLTHELGHHLGLYHTDADFLEDTTAQQHFIFGRASHQANLMNTNPDAFELTPMQIEVIKNNPMMIEIR